MPFFIPSRLIDFEYLGGNVEPDEEYDKLAKEYQSDIDFAFFVVNFNYSKDDYLAITPREKAFIMKAWEGKMVSDSTHTRNAFLNAYANANRKKGAKFNDLWNKKPKKLDKEVATENLRIVENIEKESDGSWVDKIYAANGMKKPQ